MEESESLNARFNALLASFTALKTERDGLSASNGSLTAELSSLRDNLASARKDTTDKELELRQRDSVLQELSANLDDSRERNRRQIAEKERLKKDVAQQAEQLLSVERTLLDSRKLISELQSKELPMEFELNKLRSENQRLQNKCSFLESEINEKNNMLESTRNEAASNGVRVDNALRIAELKAKTESDKASMASHRCLAAEKSASLHLSRINELESAIAEERATASFELDAAKRMSDLYQSHFNDASQRIKAIERENALLQKNRDDLTIKINDYERHIDEQRIQIETMQTELVGVQSTESPSKQKGRERARERPAIVDDDTNTTSKDSGIISVLIPSDLQGKSLDVIYEKYNEMVRTLDRARKDLELFHNSAPSVVALRQEHIRLLERHERLNKRLDEVLTLQSISQEENTNLVRKSKIDESNYGRIHRLNIDLGMQIQHLLKIISSTLNNDKVIRKDNNSSNDSNALLLTSNVNGNDNSSSKENGPHYIDYASVSQPTLMSSHLIQNESPAQSVITANLVVVDNINELQQRNAQLLQVVRQLADEKETEANDKYSSNSQTLTDDETRTLEAALREVASLRDSRSRTEIMVKELAQQRDSYKRLLDEAEELSRAASLANNKINSNYAGGSSKQNDNLIAQRIEIENGHELRKTLQARITSLEKQLIDHEDLARHNEQKYIHELAYIRSELSEKNREKERSIIEQNRITKLLHDETAMKASIEVEMDILKQKLRLNESEVRRINQSMNLTKSELYQTTLQVKASHDTEKRLMNELANAREECLKLAAISESIEKIESGLQKKNDIDVNRLLHERDEALKEYDNLKHTTQDKMLLSSQNTLRLQDELRAAETRADDLLSDTIKAKDALLRESASHHAAQQRAQVLEGQLLIAHERLSILQGIDVATTAAAIQEDAHARDAALEKSQFEVQSLKAQLTAADEHILIFKQISQTTEESLSRHKKETEELDGRYRSEILTLQNDLSAAEQLCHESEDALAIALDKISDMEKVEGQRAAEAESRAQALSKECDIISKRLTETMNELSESKQLIESLQIIAEEAKTDVQSAEEKAEAATNSLELLESKQNAMIAELNEARSIAQGVTSSIESVEEKRRYDINQLKSENGELESRVNDLRRSNDLLQGQVQSLGAQVDRLTTSTNLSRTYGIVDSNTTGMGAGIKNEDTDEDSPNEAELRRSCADLREVMRILQLERDTVEAKLSLAQSDISRHKTIAAASHRAMEDARNELKKELSRSSNTKSQSDFDLLMAEVSQLGVVRESNARLRSENEILYQRLQEAEIEVNKLHKVTIPYENKIKSLEHTIDDMNNSLNISNKLKEDWENRLNTLMTRYRTIDPQEYEELLDKYNNTTQQYTVLQSNYNEMKINYNDLQIKCEAETKGKTFNETQVEKFRNMIRALKVNYETLKKTQEAQEKSLEVEKAKSSTAESRLTAAESRAEKLTEALAAAKNAMKKMAAAGGSSAAANVSGTLTGEAETVKAKSITSERKISMTTDSNTSFSKENFKEHVEVDKKKENTTMSPDGSISTGNDTQQILQTKSIAPAVSVPALTQETKDKDKEPEIDTTKLSKAALDAKKKLARAQRFGRSSVMSNITTTLVDSTNAASSTSANVVTVTDTTTSSEEALRAAALARLKNRGRMNSVGSDGAPNSPLGALLTASAPSTATTALNVNAPEFVPGGSSVTVPASRKRPGPETTTVTGTGKSKDTTENTGAAYKVPRASDITTTTNTTTGNMVPSSSTWGAFSSSGSRDMGTIKEGKFEEEEESADENEENNTAEGDVVGVESESTEAALDSDNDFDNELSDTSNDDNGEENSNSDVHDVDFDVASRDEDEDSDGSDLDVSEEEEEDEEEEEGNIEVDISEDDQDYVTGRHHNMDDENYSQDSDGDGNDMEN
jgi:nucleoprotein TPR